MAPRFFESFSLLIEKVQIGEIRRQDIQPIVMKRVFTKLAFECNVPENSVESLITFLHQRGILLSFEENSRVRDVIVLHPQYFANRFVQLVKVKTNKPGIIPKSTIESIWGPEFSTITSLLQLFEANQLICFDLTKGDYHVVVPVLLPSNPDERELQKYWNAENLWNSFQIFQRSYQLIFLPSGQFSKIICNICSDKNISPLHYWRNGVVFAYQKTTGLVCLEEEGEFSKIKGESLEMLSFENMIIFFFHHSFHQNIETDGE